MCSPRFSSYAKHPLKPSLTTVVRGVTVAAIIVALIGVVFCSIDHTEVDG